MTESSNPAPTPPPSAAPESTTAPASTPDNPDWPALEQPEPPPVPPTPQARELRELPTPEEMTQVESEQLFSGSGNFRMIPLPGGCLVSFVPRRYRQRDWEWTS
jgi:hypothetical protein